MCATHKWVPTTALEAHARTHTHTHTHTTTTLTWPSSTTTWTRPSRRYRPLWTNWSRSPSVSRSTGCTDHHRRSLWPRSCYWAPMGGCLTVRPGGKEKRGQEVFFSREILLPKQQQKRKESSSLLLLFPPIRLCIPMQPFFYSKLKGKERLFILVFVTFYERSFY